MVTNGMFVGDEQYKQCALVVLGKGDLVDAKKDLCQHQTVKIYVSAWTQGQFQSLCTRFVGSALNLWCDLQAQNGAKGFRQEAAKRCKAEALSQWTGTNKLYGYGGEFNAEVGKQLLSSVLPLFAHFCIELATITI